MSFSTIVPQCNNTTLQLFFVSLKIYPSTKSFNFVIDFWNFYRIFCDRLRNFYRILYYFLLSFFALWCLKRAHYVIFMLDSLISSWSALFLWQINRLYAMLLAQGSRTLIYAFFIILFIKKKTQGSRTH